MDTVNVYFHQMGGIYLPQSAILPRAWCAEGVAFLAEEIIHAVHTEVCAPQTSCLRLSVKFKIEYS